MELNVRPFVHHLNLFPGRLAIVTHFEQPLTLKPFQDFGSSLFHVLFYLLLDEFIAFISIVNFGKELFRLYKLIVKLLYNNLLLHGVCDFD